MDSLSLLRVNKEAVDLNHIRDQMFLVYKQNIPQNSSRTHIEHFVG